jgi:hypothetical protein
MRIKILSILLLGVLLNCTSISARTKNGWYYGGVDAGGAYGWGSAGSAAGPLGTAVGIVAGGLLTSSWAFYWDSKSFQPVLTNPTFPACVSFSNNFEKVGFLHNKFIIQSSNKYKKPIMTNETEFVNLIYNDMIDFLSVEFKLDKSILNSTFPKVNCISYLTSYNKCNNVDASVSTFIDNQLKNSTFGKMYVEIITTLDNNSGNLNSSISYLNSKINSINTSSSITQKDKDYANYCINI